MCSDPYSFLDRLSETPFAASLTQLARSRQVLVALSDPNATSIKEVDDDLFQLTPELFAFIFKQAHIEQSEDIEQSLDEAIEQLGFERVKKLIFFYNAYSAELQNEPNPLDRAFAAQLWALNYAISSTVEYWVSLGLPEFAEEAFYVGMFQNIGISAFAQLEASKHRGLRESKRELPLAVKEKEAFGFSHYDLANAIVAEWELPSLHLAALRYEQFHGQSTIGATEEQVEDVLQLLYLSKYRCENKHYTVGLERKRYGVDTHFEFDHTLLQIAAERLKEFRTPQVVEAEKRSA